MKLNLGCGAHVVDGWVNVDYSVGARFVKLPLLRTFNRKVRLFELDWNDTIYLHDLTKTFPWADSSIDIVYSSHTLEHLSKEDGHRFLAECHRVLRPNGIVRLVVPDLRRAVNEYLGGRIHADDFVEALGVLYEHSGSALKRRLSPFIQFPHKCMYDTPRLIDILGTIGFCVSARGAFDSDIVDIRVVELEGRAEHAVIVEGRKR